MKKIKLLMPILGISAIAPTAIPLASCGCNNEPSVTQYTVKFDTQGGSTIAAVKVNKGSKVARPTDPTKPDCTFSGWYKEAACTNEFAFDTAIVRNTTLYAKWEAEQLNHPIPLTTEFYDVNESQISQGKFYIQSIKEKYLDNPKLLSNYDSLAFYDLDNINEIYVYGYAFWWDDPSQVTNLKKLICSNNTTYVQFGDQACFGLPVQEIDFGVASVYAGPQSFAIAGSSPLLQKVIVSPKTEFNCKAAVGGPGSPFLNQTNLSTIDVSSFLTEQEIQDAQWTAYNTYKVWGEGARATAGTIIIANESLKSAWTTKFSDAGLTVDGTNWKFQIK